VPLSGVRVVDLTRVLAGPFCTMMLADMGAEVIKVESPKGGDPVRHQGTIRDGLSWYFAAVNRNKRSVAIDLRSDDGRGLLDRLIRTGDVLVENFRPGVLDDMGLGPERLEALNPRLVVASINGFGSTGPYARRPAVDFVAQAMSGFMSTNGREGEEPLRCGLPLSDMIAGMQAALGIVCALREREASGRGQRVEASLVNGMISIMAYLASEYFAKGEVPRRSGNDHPLLAPYGLFRAEDGDVAIAPSNDALLGRLFEALDLAHVLRDPRFDTNGKRVERRDEINAIVGARIAEGTRDAWIERLNAAGVPSGRVMTLPEMFEDPQVQAQEMAIDVEHPGHGAVRMPGFSIKLSRTPNRARRGAPELGEDTDAVLAEQGVAPERILELRARGVIG
jgi:CoA:oxalate CoA-transferase